MATPNEKDDVLFEQLQQNKKRRRRKTLLTVAAIVAVVLTGIFIAVSVLRARVLSRFGDNAADVKSYEATVGRISTIVSGTGTIASVGSEQITLPKGVEVEEVLVSAGDVLHAGDPIATVNMASVMTALADTQDALDALDDQLSGAKNDAVSSYLTAGVPGRVKIIYAQVDVSVVDCMTEHGALAVLSLDGRMCVTVEADLTPGSEVTVTVSDEKTYPGTVESCSGGKSVITLTDNGPLYGDAVTVSDGETILGTGTLEIHAPLSVTGYAGTVRYISVRENQQVYAGTTLFSLTDTKYSANYDALLKTRANIEGDLTFLIGLLRTGAVCAPFDGTVSSVDYSDGTETVPGAAGAYAAYTGQTAVSSSSGTAVVTMAPNEQVSVTIGVDETDILSLKVGQSAEVTVSSASDDVLPGVVTEITRVGASYSGVTQYSAVITLDRIDRMLDGMTATVDVQIEGVEDVVLIPVDALHQTSNRAYVYTSFDAETQQYGGMVDVVPGVSNSNFVEIISGLQPGDTVYYTEKNRWNFFMMPGMTGGRNGYSGRSGMGG